MYFDTYLFKTLAFVLLFETSFLRQPQKDVYFVPKQNIYKQCKGFLVNRTVAALTPEKTFQLFLSTFILRLT